MSFKERLLAPIAKRLESTRKEYDILVAALEHLPELPYASVYGHGYEVDISVKFEVNLVNDIFPLMAALPPIPMSRIDDGSCTFVHDGAKRRDTAKATPVYPVVLKAENVSGPRIEATWYAMAGPQRVQVAAIISQAWTWVKWTGEKRFRDGQMYWVGAAFHHHFRGAQVVRWWSSAEYRGSYTLYWTPDADLADILAAPLEWPVNIQSR